VSFALKFTVALVLEFWSDDSKVKVTFPRFVNIFACNIWHAVKGGGAYMFYNYILLDKIIIKAAQVSLSVYELIDLLMID
jgi:hypothetical protein